MNSDSELYSWLQHTGGDRIQVPINYLFETKIIFFSKFKKIRDDVPLIFF